MTAKDTTLTDEMGSREVESAEARQEMNVEREMLQDVRQPDNVCACCRHKNTPREEREQKKLNSRINRIIGQLNGIQNMIDDNRYCGDILIQIGAVESALQGLGYQILQEHLETCVVEEVKQGNTTIMREAVELMKKLK